MRRRSGISTDERSLGDLMKPRQGPDQPVRMHTMATISSDGTQYVTVTERMPPSEAGAEPGPSARYVRG